MIYAFLAEGFEEIEAVATIDVLRRAGYDVKIVGVGSGVVTGSHRITITADIGIDDISYDGIEAIILPGGQPGTENLYNCQKVRDCIEYCVQQDIIIGAICAAPSILGRMGLLKGKNAVCYPGFEHYLTDADVQMQERVCTDGNIVTGKGPGCSIDFALTIVSIFKSKLESLKLRADLQCK